MVLDFSVKSHVEGLLLLHSIKFLALNIRSSLCNSCVSLGSDRRRLSACKYINIKYIFIVVFKFVSLFVVISVQHMFCTVLYSFCPVISCA